MKNIYIFCSILLMCGLVFPKHPSKKSIIGEFEFDINGVSNDIIKEEDLLVSNRLVFLTRTNSVTNKTDTIYPRYSYAAYLVKLQCSYHTSDDIALGIKYTRNFITQFIDNKEVSANSTGDLLTANQLGPTLNLWFPLFRAKAIVATLNPFYAFGTLKRMASMSEVVSEQSTFGNDFHKDVDVSGYGIGIELPFYMINKSGIFFKIGANYSFTKYNLSGDNFTYMHSTSNHEYGLVLGVGYATNLR